MTTEEYVQNRVVSVRFQVWKMLNDGYTTEQIEEWLTVNVEQWKIKTREIISALVQSRVEELDAKGKVEKALGVLSGE